MGNIKRFAPIKLIDTGSMTHEQFAQARQSISIVTGGVAFGGSDMASIFGISPWRSPQELYNQKTGVTPAVTVERNASAKEAGNILEEAVSQLALQRIKELFGKDIRIEKDTFMYQCGNPEYPFAVANLDRVLTAQGRKGILEIKTTSPRNRRDVENWRKGIVPEHYLLQGKFYMEVMDYDYVIFACMWEVGESGLAIIKVDRDREEGKKMMNFVKDFAQHVLDKTEPDFKACSPEVLSDYYTRLYGVDEKAPPTDLTGHDAEIYEALDLTEKIDELSNKIKKLEKQRTAIFNLWRPIMADSTTALCYMGGETAKIEAKAGFNRPKLDEAKLKEEYPDLYKEYTLPSFSEAKFKKEHPDIYSLFVDEKKLNPDKEVTFKISGVTKEKEVDDDDDWLF